MICFFHSLQRHSHLPLLTIIIQHHKKQYTIISLMIGKANAEPEQIQQLTNFLLWLSDDENKVAAMGCYNLSSKWKFTRFHTWKNIESSCWWLELLIVEWYLNSTINLVGFRVGSNVYNQSKKRNNIQQANDCKCFAFLLFLMTLTFIFAECCNSTS